MIDPYATLGLARTASPEEAKQAFRKQAKTCHPDLHPNDPKAEARFKELNAAYEAIINPAGAQPGPQAGPHASAYQGGQGPQWRTYHFNMPPGHTPFADFDDLFGQIHGLHGFRPQPRSDVTYEARLTLEEIFHGKDITVNLQVGGSTREIKVTVPPGIEDGTRLVVPQAVHQGHPNLRPGDLIIIIRNIPHSRFARHGKNLLLTVPVTVFDVLLGNDIEVVGIDGNVLRVAIPPNFDSTRKLRLAGQGLADQRGSRGDLLVELFVTYPPLSEADRATLKKLAEAKQT